jgi:hypothetical protein
LVVNLLKEVGGEIKAATIADNGVDPALRTEGCIPGSVNPLFDLIAGESFAAITAGTSISPFDLLAIMASVTVGNPNRVQLFGEDDGPKLVHAGMILIAIPATQRYTFSFNF